MDSRRDGQQKSSSTNLVLMQKASEKEQSDWDSDLIPLQLQDN